MSEEKEKLTKDEFIRTIAERAHFTIGNVRIIWDEAEEFFKDVIYFEKELVLPGMFKLYVTTIKAHKGHDAVRNKAMLVPESKRINFRASRSLLDLFKEEEDEDDK